MAPSYVFQPNDIFVHVVVYTWQHSCRCTAQCLVWTIYSTRGILYIIIHKLKVLVATFSCLASSTCYDSIISYHKCTSALVKYRIAGNFGEVFNLAISVYTQHVDGQIKNSPIELNACTPMAVSVQITKFKLRQYQQRAISPNLMLAKVACYTVLQEIRTLTNTLLLVLNNLTKAEPKWSVVSCDQPIGLYLELNLSNRWKVFRSCINTIARIVSNCKSTYIKEKGKLLLLSLLLYYTLGNCILLLCSLPPSTLIDSLGGTRLYMQIAIVVHINVTCRLI